MTTINLLTMIKNLYLPFILFGAALLFASCQDLKEDSRESGSREQVILSVCAELRQMKGAFAQVNDSKIDSIQVFIFTSDGILESSRRMRASSLEISCIPGNKIIWVLANAPELSLETGALESVLTGSALYLKDNAFSSLMMTGRAEVEISEDGPLNVSVDRLPALVRFGSVKTDFTGSYLEGCSFVVNDVYLRNVMGESRVRGVFNPEAGSLWYNKITDEQNAEADALIGDKGLNRAVADGSEEAFGLAYLVFPNSVAEDDESPVWSVRRTHLVVHATIDGEDTYYPIVLPVIARNRIYNVKTVTLTMAGNPNPEDPPISTAGISLNISIAPWEGEDEITYTL